MASLGCPSQVDAVGAGAVVEPRGTWRNGGLQQLPKSVIRPQPPAGRGIREVGTADHDEALSGPPFIPSATFPSFPSFPSSSRISGPAVVAPSYSRSINQQNRPRFLPASAHFSDEMLDDITLYWLTNTAASSVRLYWENNNNSNVLEQKDKGDLHPGCRNGLPRRDLPGAQELGLACLSQAHLLQRGQ